MTRELSSPARGWTHETCQNESAIWSRCKSIDTSMGMLAERMATNGDRYAPTGRTQKRNGREEPELIRISNMRWNTIIDKFMKDNYPRGITQAINLHDSENTLEELSKTLPIWFEQWFNSKWLNSPYTPIRYLDLPQETHQALLEYALLALEYKLLYLLALLLWERSDTAREDDKKSLSTRDKKFIEAYKDEVIDISPDTELYLTFWFTTLRTRERHIRCIRTPWITMAASEPQTEYEAEQRCVETVEGIRREMETMIHNGLTIPTMPGQVIRSVLPVGKKNNP